MYKNHYRKRIFQSALKNMREIEFIEGGKNGEFDFILEKCSNRSKNKESYGRTMRFYKFHEDYVGYIEIKYITFECHRFYISIALPWTDTISKIIYIQKDELKKKGITYLTSTSPIYNGKEVDAL